MYNYNCFGTYFWNISRYRTNDIYDKQTLVYLSTTQIYIFYK